MDISTLNTVRITRAMIDAQKELADSSKSMKARLDNALESLKVISDLL